MSGDEKKGPMIATAEVISVDVSEVDSIHGAKPEPEERPAFVTDQIDPNTGDQPLVDGKARLQLAPNALTVRTEHSVDELVALFGMTCRNCLHFHHELGQATILRLGYGTPEERQHIVDLVAELAMSDAGNMRGRDLAGDEYVADGFAPMGAELELQKYGLCCVLSDEQKDDILMHPDCLCPAKELVGHQTWDARTPEIARTVQMARDRLLNVAAGRTRG